MNAELIDYYKNLLIMQYRDKTKAIAHTENIIKSGMIYDIMIAVRDAFGIEDAVGVQQDILGKILGVSRTILGTTFTREYYGYSVYGDTAPFTFHPMLVYGEAAPDVQFRNYTEGEQSLYNLTDEEYRVIQKLAIVRNNSNASVKTIDDILNALFGAECYFIDRMNMTVVSYMVGSRWSRIFQIAKSEGLLPNPAGVGTSLVVVPDIKNIFSYSLYGGAKPEFAVGYIKYPEWTPEGNALPLPTSLSLPYMTKLTETKIVLSSSDGYLQAYFFDGEDWLLLGNNFYLGIGSHNITSLSETRIISIDINGYLQAYDFDGTDWSAVGNSLLVSSLSVYSAKLTETRIVVNSYGVIRAYDFDGTDWTSVGSYLAFERTFIFITGLSSSRIVVSSGLGVFTAVDFNGSSWTLYGDEKTSGATKIQAITSLDSNKIVAQLESPDVLQSYILDGTTWNEFGTPAATDSVSNGTIFASLSEKSFARANLYLLKKYILYNDTTGCLASYS